MTLAIVFMISFLIATWASHVATTKIRVQLLHRNPALVRAQAAGDYDDDVVAPLIPATDESLFWANISIGDPPQPQLLAMDTGSSLTWVGMTNPTYDRKRSSTFIIYSCYSSYDCLGNYNSKCERDYSHSEYALTSRCTYSVSYSDGTSSKGVVGHETFTFESSTGSIVEVPYVLFGVETERVGGIPNYLPGILGLEARPNSLVSRFGYKFSFCVGDLRDPKYPYSSLILGEGAIIQGDFTPMRTNSDYRYVITLTGISVGDTKLEIDVSKFRNKVMLDTGSTFIHLPETEYNQLKTEVRRLVDASIRTVKAYKYEDCLCFRGDKDRDLKEFPIVTLHLANDVNLRLEVDSIFLNTDNGEFCLAVAKSDSYVSVIGATAMQYYNIGFDVSGGWVSFQSVDCELLLD